eukprot:TRINITY_DN1108_c0_g3_i2.p1 TRINITY_DN1108_c0_g3~~TRINITY_DN1108_c0_g3_i2.p1  ORF type:complete len:520 (-),score=96.42 TRINITY_DN1108_c0_g3_i2:459-2018(-)
MSLYLTLPNAPTEAQDVILNELSKVGEVRDWSVFDEGKKGEASKPLEIVLDHDEKKKSVMLDNFQVLRAQFRNRTTLHRLSQSFKEGNLPPGVFGFSINCKMVVVGDDEIPKTELLKTYIVGRDPKEPPAKISNFNTFVNLDGLEVNLDLWDLPSANEQTEEQRASFYQNADVILLMFSVVRPSSLEHVKTVWSNEVKKYCPNTPVILVGTEAHLRDQKSSKGAISTVQGEEYSHQAAFSNYLECTDTFHSIDSLITMSIHYAIGDYHYGDDIHFEISSIACEDLRRRSNVDSTHGAASASTDSHGHHQPSPYVKFETKKKVLQTTPQKETSNPSWSNVGFSFSTKDVEKEIVVKVKHHRTVLQDENIGYCLIPISVLVTEFVDKGATSFSRSYWLKRPRRGSVLSPAPTSHHPHNNTSPSGSPAPSPSVSQAHPHPPSTTSTSSITTTTTTTTTTTSATIPSSPVPSHTPSPPSSPPSSPAGSPPTSPFFSRNQSPRSGEDETYGKITLSFKLAEVKQ